MGDAIDLSDLDPFAPPSRTNSPLFPSSSAPPSSSTTTTHRSTTPLPPPRLEAKPTGSDPLGSISLLNFATRQSNPSSRAGSPAPAPPALPALPPIQADPVRAQEERQAAVWGDLSRQPWSAAPQAMNVGEAVARPSAGGPGADRFDATGGGVSIAAPSHGRLERRQSLSRSPTLSFSPPRRLSGLMEGTHQAFAARADSQTSRGETAPFHPASPSAGGASSAARRASFSRHRPDPPAASGSYVGGGGGGGADDSSFGEWTDFQTAISDAVADDFGFPAPTPPIATPAPAPSARPFAPSTSSFFSHSPIHFPSASSSSTSPKPAPTPKPPAAPPSARPLPKVASTVPVPTNGHAPSGGAPGPGSKGWKKEWTYDASGADAIQGIKLLGVKAGTNKVLSEDVAEGVSTRSGRVVRRARLGAKRFLGMVLQIRPHLPPRHRLSSKWTLLYSLDQHGTALSTLYSRVTGGMKGADGGCVLVIRDGRGDTFGAYSSEPFHEQQGYYGDGTWSATFRLLSHSRSH